MSINLKWTPTKHRRLKSRIFNGVLRKAPSGVSAIYVRISKRVGVKLYYSRRTRNSCAYWQQVAYENNAGPPVGELVCLKGKDLLSHAKKDIKIGRHWWWSKRKPGAYLYGYLTYHTKVDNTFKATNAQLHKLCDQLEDLGMMSMDCIGHNVGWYNKKLVCIDFDPASIGKSSYEKHC